MRLIASAVTLAVFCFGVVVLNAEEIRCKIVKVDGSKVTINKSTKENKVADEVLTAAKDIKVVNGKYDKEAKKVVSGDAIEKGLANDMFTKIDEKGLRGLVVTDDKTKEITEIRIMQKKKKGN